MSVSRVFVLGPDHIGKSSLVKSLCNPDDNFNPHHQYREGTDFYPLPNASVQLWDIASSDKKHSFVIMRSTVRLLAYCVDLSNSDELSDVEKIKNDIADWLFYFPDAPVVLVGTRHDLLTQKSSQEIEESNQKFDLLAQQLQEFNVSKSYKTSAKNKEGVDLLRQTILDCTKQTSANDVKIVSSPSNPMISPINTALQMLPEGSVLYEAIDNLNDEMATLPAKSVQFIEEQVLKFVTTFKGTGSVESKEQAITDFKNNCDSHLAGKHSLFKAIVKAIAVVAITAFVTILAALVGFGIGFAAGAWTGPGAFISGILAGSGAGAAVVFSSGIIGAAAGALSAYRFFKSSPIKEAVDEVANAARSKLVAENMSHYSGVDYEGHQETSSSAHSASSAVFPWTPFAGNFPLYWGW